MGRLARARWNRTCPRSDGGVAHSEYSSPGERSGPFPPPVASCCTSCIRGRLPVQTGLRGWFHPWLRRAVGRECQPPGSGLLFGTGCRNRAVVGRWPTGRVFLSDP
jgi:hypothetical protein